jgi:hypothetical protein
MSSAPRLVACTMVPACSTAADCSTATACATRSSNCAPGAGIECDRAHVPQDERPLARCKRLRACEWPAAIGAGGQRTPALRPSPPPPGRVRSRPRLLHVALVVAAGRSPARAARPRSSGRWRSCTASKPVRCSSGSMSTSTSPVARISPPKPQRARAAAAPGCRRGRRSTCGNCSTTSASRARRSAASGSTSACWAAAARRWAGLGRPGARSACHCSSVSSRSAAGGVGKRAVLAGTRCQRSCRGSMKRMVDVFRRRRRGARRTASAAAAEGRVPSGGGVDEALAGRRWRR